MTQIITVHGGLTAQPELKFTNNSTPLATFTVASSDRVLNRDTGKWEDGKDKLFLRCTAWGTIAENITASALEKGQQVTVTGKLLTREWEQDGQRRSQVELKVTDFAVSLKHATAQVARSQKPQGSPDASRGAGTDPWSSTPSNGAQGGFQDPWFAGGFDDGQPF